MKKFLLYTIAVLAAFSSYAQSPSIMWRFDTHDESFGNGAIGKLDSTGREEIAFSCYWNDSNIYVIHADDGSLVWKQNMGGCNDAAPLLYDVDGSGQLDVILGSSCNPVLTCFNGATGQIKWQTPFGGTDSPPSIDLDSAGIPQIFVGDFEGNLNCYNARNGHLKWQKVVDANSAIEASPALVDVNGDGTRDIVVCTWSYGGSGDSTAIYAYDGKTDSLIWINRLPTDVIYHGAAFADVLENGSVQLAISSYDGNVYLLNGADGSLAWNYPTPGLAYIADPVVIGDLDKDGHLDLVYINGNGEVDALDRNGHFMWSYTLDLYESSFRGAVLADVNNDDTLDVIFCTTEGKLYALNGSRGNLLWSLDLNADYGNPIFELEHGPIVADFKGDDTLDIFVVGGWADSDSLPGDFGRAYGIKVGKGQGPEWTMFQHDLVRSNCVCNVDSAVTADTIIVRDTIIVIDTSVVADTIIVRDSLLVQDTLFITDSIFISDTLQVGFANMLAPEIKLQDYPNPFRQEIYFNVSLSAPTQLSVAIYNEQGIVVRTFAESQRGAGGYNFSWDGTDDTGHQLASGIYFSRITAGHTCSIRKIVLTR